MMQHTSEPNAFPVKM